MIMHVVKKSRWLLISIVIMLAATSTQSQTILILNGDFESPTWVNNNGGTWTQQPVPPGTQARNYNELDPRFGVPGFGKTAISGNTSAGNIGPNGEGIYSERNDLDHNQFFKYVDGHLPAPANGKNFFCIQPSSPTFNPGPNSSYAAAWSNSWPDDKQASDVNSFRYKYVPGTCQLSAMYNVFIDQQPDQTTLAGKHADLKYPPMIPATTAIAGHTYQVTVALGNPLWNAANGNSNFPVVELEFTIGAGTFNMPSGTNSLTTPPPKGDTWLFYNGYGNTVATAWANGSSDPKWQIAPGTFNDLSLTWTCPKQDDGKPLNIQLNFTGFTQTPGTSLPNMVAMDNIRLVDVTTKAP
jgi:hypothetical protein